MSQSSQVAGFFDQVQATLSVMFRGWEKDMTHPGEKGGIRERRVADFLSSILPKRYGIGTGHIIDRDARSSYQADIVIYDAENGLALPADNHYSIFPCECVYAVIEVKSELNASYGEHGPSGTVYDCVKSTNQLKALNREHHGLHPIHSLVFAYTTCWSSAPQDHLRKWFNRFGEGSTELLPEMVFVLEPSFVLGTSGPTGENTQGRFTHLYQKDPLLFFVSDLIYRLSSVSVATPNLWHDYSDWLSGDVGVRIYEYG